MILPMVLYPVCVFLNQRNTLFPLSPPSTLTVINKDVASDPTLPHSKNLGLDEIKCPRCGYDDAVYFQSQANRDQVWFPWRIAPRLRFHQSPGHLAGPNTTPAHVTLPRARLLVNFLVEHEVVLCVLFKAVRAQVVRYRKEGRGRRGC